MAQELDGTEPVNIKVFGLISEAYGFVKANAKTLLRLSFIPFLVIFVANLLPIFLEMMWYLDGLSQTLGKIIQYGVLIVYAVAVHRFFLLHERLTERLCSAQCRPEAKKLVVVQRSQIARHTAGNFAVIQISSLITLGRSRTARPCPARQAEIYLGVVYGHGVAPFGAGWAGPQ